MNLIPRMDRLVLKIGDISSLSFLLCLILTLKEVFWRYALGAPSTWAQDATAMLCAIGFSFGGAYAMAENKHIKVTVVYDLFPKPLKTLCDKFGLLIGALYLAALGYGLGGLMFSAVFRFPNGEWNPESTVVPPYLPIPSVTKTTLFAGAVLFCVVTTVKLLADKKDRTDDV